MLRRPPPRRRGGEVRSGALAALLGLLLLAAAAVAVCAAEDLAAFAANVALAHRRAPFSVVRCPLHQNLTAPGLDRLPELGHDIRLSAAGALGPPERMIGSLDDVQGGPRVQAAAHRLEEREVGEVIPRALQEQHRNPDRVEMIRAFGAGPPRRGR